MTVNVIGLSKILTNVCGFLILLSVSALAQSDQAATTIKPNITPNANTEIYKLVFLTGGLDDKSYSKLGKKKEAQQRRNDQAEFITKLNEAGSQGYRAILTQGLFAIVKLDNTPYEYAGFETDEGGRSIQRGLKNRYLSFAQQAYALRDYTLMSHQCETKYLNSPGEMQEWRQDSCSWIYWFLWERVKGDTRPAELILASNNPTSNKATVQAETAAADLTMQVKEALAKGYQVTHSFSKFELLLQKTNQSDFSPQDSEIQVINDGVSEDKIEALKTKINSLAQQGYRLASLGYDIAVMYRPKGTTLPVSYVWLNVIPKNAESELAQLQSKGAVYRMIHPGENGERALMVFEQPMNSNASQREYKLLKMELEGIEKKAEKKVVIELTPETKDVMKTVNQLAQEGFIVRDQLAGGNKTEGKRRISVTNILMERTR